MPSPMRCPRCRTDLVVVGRADWQMYRCPGCAGTASTMALLRRFAPPERMKALWRRIDGGAPGEPCPSCGRRMRAVAADCGGRSVDLDACRACQVVWFDAQELAAFSPERQEPRTPDDDLPPAVAREFALWKAQALRDAADAGRADAAEAGGILDVILRLLFR